MATFIELILGHSRRFQLVLRLDFVEVPFSKLATYYSLVFSISFKKAGGCANVELMWQLTLNQSYSVKIR